MRRTLFAALFFVGLVAIWAALVQAKIWSPVLLPSPRSVLDYLVSAARDGSLVTASGVTLRRLLIGYFIGLAIGLPLGLLTASLKFAEDTVGVLALGLQMSQRVLCLLEDILPPVKQLQPEILALALIHEWLFVARPIDSGVHPKANSVALAVFMGLIERPTVSAFGQLHLRVLPQPTSRSALSRGGL